MTYCELLKWGVWVISMLHFNGSLHFSIPHRADNGQHYYSSSFSLFQLLRRHSGANHKPWLTCQSCSINSRCVSRWNISPLISFWFIPLDFVVDSSVTIMHLACFRGLGKTASHSRERQHRDYLSPCVSGLANVRHSTCEVIHVNSNDCSDWYCVITVVPRIFFFVSGFFGTKWISMSCKK